LVLLVLVAGGYLGWRYIFTGEDIDKYCSLLAGDGLTPEDISTGDVAWATDLYEQLAKVAPREARPPIKRVRDFYLEYGPQMDEILAKIDRGDRNVTDSDQVVLEALEEEGIAADIMQTWTDALKYCAPVGTPK
jgi:regulator of extracellular matrix RemA (YlzA/DUF370 family)